MGLLNIFKKKGRTYANQRDGDYQAVKQASKMGLLNGKRTNRDRAMIALGKVEVHNQQQQVYYHKTGTTPKKKKGGFREWDKKHSGK